MTQGGIVRDERRHASGRGWIGIVGITLAFLGALACDEVDVRVALPSLEESGDSEPPPTKLGDRRSPDMESVGPEEALRIYYQFIDDRGKVRFVERLSDVPDAWREQVGYVEMSQPPPLTPREARESWRLSSKRATEIMLANLPDAASEQPVSGQSESVILYSATWCGYCKKARAHLDGAGIRYELRDVDNEAIGRELREKTGRGGVPVLDFSGEILRGYSAEAYDKAIRTIRG